MTSMAYFDRQDDEASCGRHAVNNLLRGTYFAKNEGLVLTRDDLDGSFLPRERLVMSNQRINMLAFCKLVQQVLRDSGQEIPRCDPAENYVFDILRYALALFGAKLVRQYIDETRIRSARSPVNQIARDLYDNEIGKRSTRLYLMNRGNAHWTAAISNQSTFQKFYNSTSKTPISFPSREELLQAIIEDPDIGQNLEVDVFEFIDDGRPINVLELIQNPYGFMFEGGRKDRYERSNRYETSNRHMTSNRYSDR
jgi:hypothetical protein